MDAGDQDLIKSRELRFSALHPGPEQAHTAALLLSGVEGIVSAHPADTHTLHVSYDVTRITLQAIDGGLTDLGYHLENSLLCRLKRALYYYTEEIQRENLGLKGCCGTSVQVFINRYQRLRHGCRDLRPTHWRNYL